MRQRYKTKCWCGMLRDREALLAWAEKKLGQQLCWLWQEQDQRGQGSERSFRYEHPSRQRQWLEESPCRGCPCESRCDQVCSLRALWWDARMKKLRRRLGLEE